MWLCETSVVLIEGDLHCGWSGSGTSNIESTRVLVSVEYPSFILHVNMVFQLEEKKKTFSLCEHCTLSLLICELECLQFANTQNCT